MRKLLFVCTFLVAYLRSEAQTVGLYQNTPASFNGYTLFASIFGKNTHLIDNCGKNVHSWKGTFANSRTSAYLLPDGTLIRSGNDPANPVFGPSAGGLFERLDWNGNVLWSYKISDSAQAAHHDYTVMPNGNLLVVIWQSLSASELIANGRNPANINANFWADKIVELAPVGSDSAIIVWEWRSWDHLVQDHSNSLPNYAPIPDHPELIDINLLPSTNGSWMHLNSIDYNADLDQILFSVRNFNEFMIIDHSTSTAEAAGHTGGKRKRGGDILYRWGNPESYKAGNSADRKLFQQHDAKWIRTDFPRAGEIMVFNNGAGRPTGSYSTVEIIKPPLQSDSSYALAPHQPFGPVSYSWIYPVQPDTAFYSATMGGASMQPNGNVLICEASKGNLFEVDSMGATVWKYVSPLTPTGVLAQGQNGNNAVFKVTRYDPPYSGFNSQTLTSGLPIETNPLPYVCSLYVVNSVTPVLNRTKSMTIYPNPSTGRVNIELTTEKESKWNVRVYDVSGRIASSFPYGAKEGMNNIQIDLMHLPQGCYLVEASSTNTKLKEVIVVN